MTLYQCVLTIEPDLDTLRHCIFGSCTRILTSSFKYGHVCFFWHPLRAFLRLAARSLGAEEEKRESYTVGSVSMIMFFGLGGRSQQEVSRDHHS